MRRKWVIFILTHGYTLFIVGHLYLGDWCRRCQVIFNTVPIIVFGGLIYIWNETGNVRLEKIERIYLKYLLFNLTFIYCYYSICVFSMPKWVYDKNLQVAAFILITFTFYIFNYRERK